MHHEPSLAIRSAHHILLGTCCSTVNLLSRVSIATLVSIAMLTRDIDSNSVCLSVQKSVTLQYCIEAT